MANAPRRCYEWTRPSQPLLFDKRDDKRIPGSSYLLTVRLPPISDGFPGFIFNGRDNLGIPYLARAVPLTLVGVVIEVTTADLIVTWSGVSLPRPAAKLVYALLEDQHGGVYAVSLTTLHSGDRLHGLSTTDFNLAGFPRWVGRVDPNDPQSLVLGIPRFKPDKCPPGSFPPLRIGWSYAEDGDFEALELVVAKDAVIRPGSWLTYKLVELGTRRDLRSAREISVELNKIYLEARASGAMFGDPAASEFEYVQYRNRMEDRDISPYPSDYSSDEDSSDEEMEPAEGSGLPGVGLAGPSSPIPSLGKHGMGILDGDETPARKITLFTDVKREEPKAEDWDIPGLGTSEDTLCNLAFELAKRGVFMAINSKQWCDDLYEPVVGELCDRHQKVFEALVEGSSHVGWVPPANVGSAVAPSRWWMDERAIAGQFHPPASGWSRLGGFVYLEDSAQGDPAELHPMLRSQTRRSQLSTINSQMSFVYRLRCFYPDHCQPYPLFWPFEEPLPQDPKRVTLMWDLRLDVQVPGGPGALVESSLLAVLAFQEGWTPVYDLGGLPSFTSPFEVILLPVRAYLPASGSLVVGGATTDDTILGEDCVVFGAEHLERARRDFPEYLSWCFQEWTNQTARQLTSDMPELAVTHCIMGRMPQEFETFYSTWLVEPSIDFGLEAYILQKLNPSEYDMRRRLADQIWTEESFELSAYGFRPAGPLSYDDPDFPFARPLGPSSWSSDVHQLVELPEHMTSDGASSPPARTRPVGEFTWGSTQVLWGDTKFVNDQAFSLSNELFNFPAPASTPHEQIQTPGTKRWRTSGSLDGRRVSFDTGAGPPPSSPEGAQFRSPVVHRTILSYGPLAASGRAKGRKPPTQVLATAELERVEALRLTRDTPQRAPSLRHPDTPYPELGKTGTANLRSGSAGQGGGVPTGPQVEAKGNLRDDLRRESVGTPTPTASGRPGTPSGTPPLEQEEDSTEAWARAHRDGYRDLAFGDPIYLKRMAMAAENKVQHKAQAEVYKDLGMHDHLTELLTNPALGGVMSMMPSVYHIGGVAGHLTEFKPSMNGSSRLNAARSVLYHSAFWSNPELYVQVRVKFTPRLVTVMAFAYFKGPMGLHPADIQVVPDDQLIESLNLKYHLGGKVLPSSGMGKLAPPDYSKVAPTFTLLWEQLEHLSLVFCMFYGKMYQIPLMAIITDIKAIQRSNFGFTPLEAANLFSRTLAYHQDRLIASFTSGDLVDFKSIEDLMQDFESNEVDVISRIGVMPRLVPGSQAYIDLHQNKQDFFRKLNEDIGVRTLREASELTSAKQRGPLMKKPPTYGSLPDEPPGSAIDLPRSPYGIELPGAGEVPNVPPFVPSGANTPGPKPILPKPPAPSAPPTRRPRFPVLSTECLGRGMYALFELQKSLVTSGSLAPGEEICLRFLSHTSCTKCERAHLKPAVLSGVTLSPWLKILLLAHRGYRGDKVVTESTAPARLAQLMAEGSV